VVSGAAQKAKWSIVEIALYLNVIKISRGNCMKTRSFLKLMALLFVAFLSIPSNAQNCIVFGSDVHAQTNYRSITNGIDNLNVLLDQWVFWNGGQAPGCDFFGLCGDQVRQYNPQNPPVQDDYNWVTSLWAWYNQNRNSNKGIMVCSEGNHDNKIPGFPCYNVNSSGNLSGPTNVHGFKLNLPFANVFAINSDDFASEKVKDSLVYFFEYYLQSSQRNGKLMIIMSHFPLHTKKIEIGLIIYLQSLIVMPIKIKFAVAILLMLYLYGDTLTVKAIRSI
jgi:hypothetical protein